MRYSGFVAARADIRGLEHRELPTARWKHGIDHGVRRLQVRVDERADNRRPAGGEQAAATSFVDRPAETTGGRFLDAVGQAARQLTLAMLGSKFWVSNGWNIMPQPPLMIGWPAPSTL